MNLDIEIPNRNFHELCNVIKWKEAPHTYNTLIPQHYYKYNFLST